MFAIVVNEKGGEQKRLEFDKPEVTIGRVQGNDIILPKGNVSKRHSRIVLKDGKFIIVDLKSTNGTYVNGRKITSPLVVKGSDKIYIGDFILSIEELAGAGVAADDSASMGARPRAATIPPPPPAPRGRPSTVPGTADEEGEPMGAPPQFGAPAHGAGAMGDEELGRRAICRSRCPVRRGRARCRVRPPPSRATAGRRCRRRRARAPSQPPPAAAPAPRPASRTDLPSMAPRPSPVRRRPRPAPPPSRPPASARPASSAGDRAGSRRPGGRRATSAAPARSRSASASPSACASCRRGWCSSSSWRRAGSTSPADDDLWARAESAAGQLVDQLSADGSLPAGVEPDALSKDVVQETLGVGPLEELLCRRQRARDRGGAARSHLRRARGHADAGAQVVQLAGGGRARAAAHAGARRPRSRSRRRALERHARRGAGGERPAADGGAAADGRAWAGDHDPAAAARGGRAWPIWSAQGLLSQGMADFLDLAVKSRRNIVVSGPAASGRSTLVTALARAADEGERIVSVEEAEELDLGDGPWIPLVGGRGRKARDALNNALRLKPERLIVGDVRGAEALDLIGALAGGSDGCRLRGAGGLAARRDGAVDGDGAAGARKRRRPTRSPKS